MPSPNPVASILTGDIVERIRRLELFSRYEVEGMFAGENRSPFKGFSTDFLQHRQYFHGDNLKYLDWRVFGRTDRLFVREFEQLTNAQISLIVDMSASMAFAGEGHSKLEFTVRCAGLLAYIMFLQRDDFGLLLFNENVVDLLRPASSQRHLYRVFERLVSTRPAGETAFRKGLLEAESRIPRKGIITVFSDFMDDPDTITKCLGRFRMRGHDVIAFQVYDEAEASLDYIDFTRFRDLESQDVIGVDPLLVQEEYRRQFRQHQQEVKAGCLRNGVDYVRLPVSQHFDEVMGDYLQHRMAMML